MKFSNLSIHDFGKYVEFQHNNGNTEIGKINLINIAGYKIDIRINVISAQEPDYWISKSHPEYLEDDPTIKFIEA